MNLFVCVLYLLKKLKIKIDKTKIFNFIQEILILLQKLLFNKFAFVP